MAWKKIYIHYKTCPGSFILLIQISFSGLEIALKTRLPHKYKATLVFQRQNRCCERELNKKYLDFFLAYFNACCPVIDKHLVPPLLRTTALSRTIPVSLHHYDQLFKMQKLYSTTCCLDICSIIMLFSIIWWITSAMMSRECTLTSIFNKPYLLPAFCGR